jgi:hypothetical protein
MSSAEVLHLYGGRAGLEPATNGFSPRLELWATRPDAYCPILTFFGKHQQTLGICDRLNSPHTCSAISSR